MEYLQYIETHIGIPVIVPTEAAVRLYEGDYWSDRGAWDLAMTDEFAAGVGLRLGLLSPADLAGRRSRVDSYSGAKEEVAVRAAGYRWALAQEA